MMAQWQCKSIHPHCKALLSQGDFPQIIELILLFVVFYTCWPQKHAYTWLIYLSLCIWIATAMMVCLEMVKQEYLKRHAKFPDQCSPLHYAHAEFWLWGWSWKKPYAVLLSDLLIPEEYQSWFLLQVDMDPVICTQIYVNLLDVCHWKSLPTL